MTEPANSVINALGGQVVVTTMITALAGFIVACTTAALTYSYTKRREREAELRKEKLEHYKDFIISVSDNLDGEATPESHRAFARACNRLCLVAPQPVVKAMQAYQHEIRVTNTNRSREQHDHLWTRLLCEIRADLQITPADKDTTMGFHLWASGKPPNAITDVE